MFHLEGSRVVAATHQLDKKVFSILRLAYSSAFNVVYCVIYNQIVEALDSQHSAQIEGVVVSLSSSSSSESI